MNILDTSNKVFINIYDIFDDLTEENKRLTHQILISNNYLTILLKFRNKLLNILSEYNSHINNENKNEINELETEYSNYLKQNSLINRNNEPNDCNNYNTNQNGLKKSYKHCLSLEKKCDLIWNMDRKLYANKQISNMFAVSLPTVNYIYKHKRKYITQYRNKYNNDYVPNDFKREANGHQNDSTKQTIVEANKTKKLTDDNNEQNKLDHEVRDRKIKRGKNGFSCEWIGCGYSVCNRNKLLEHVNATHTGLRPYKCDIPECGKQFAKKYCLNMHIKSHSKTKLFACDICGSKLKSKLTLKFHTMLHRNEKPFSCDFPNCSYKALTAYILDNHRRQMHTNEKPFKCDYSDCNSRFSTKNGLRSHQITHSDQKRYACDWPQCDARFKRLFLLKNHRCLHVNNRLNCDWPGCEFECSLPRQMRMHRARRHLEKKAVCTWPGCGLAFIDSYRMKVHLTRHTGNKQCKCVWPNCDKSFATNSRLEAHVAIHKGDKRHKCLWPACDKSFVDAGNMKKHFRVHLKT